MSKDNPTGGLPLAIEIERMTIGVHLEWMKRFSALKYMMSPVTKFAQTFLGIARRAEADIARLQRQPELDHAILALTARNLLELRVYLKQMGKDETFRAILAEHGTAQIHMLNGEEVLTRRVLDQILRADDYDRELSQLAAQRKVILGEQFETKKKFVRAQALERHGVVLRQKNALRDPNASKDVGLIFQDEDARINTGQFIGAREVSEDYPKISQYLAKFIHPTAFSIMEDISLLYTDANWKLLFHFYRDMVTELRSELTALLKEVSKSD